MPVYTHLWPTILLLSIWVAPEGPGARGERVWREVKKACGDGLEGGSSRRWQCRPPPLAPGRAAARRWAKCDCALSIRLDQIG